jgi:guanylate kinase
MIKFRLANAKKDMEEAHWYHYAIVNEKVEDTVEKLKTIMMAERCKKKKSSILEKKLKQWEEDHG